VISCSAILVGHRQEALDISTVSPPALGTVVGYLAGRIDRTTLVRVTILQARVMGRNPITGRCEIQGVFYRPMLNT
jgi:hypothetical protein